MTKTFTRKRTGLYLVCIIIIFLSIGAPENMDAPLTDMPEKIDIYTKTDSMQFIHSGNIFDYMNGAGELYLGYGFNHLEVYNYKAVNQPDILVELYLMKTTDDAFGLLSMDWGGEPVIQSHVPLPPGKKYIAPSGRALYGGGLLRLCSENMYARIMAFPETETSRKAVIELGKMLTANHSKTNEPQLLSVLPASTASGWRVMPDRIGFFRSYLVLNSLFYLSHNNILNLDHSCEAVTASYEKDSDEKKSNRIQLLFINYKNRQSADDGLSRFYNAYLPEQKIKVLSGSKKEDIILVRLEDGWLGIKQTGSRAGLVFTSPDQNSAREILNNVHFKQE